MGPTIGPRAFEPQTSTSKNSYRAMFYSYGGTTIWAAICNIFVGRKLFIITVENIFSYNILYEVCQRHVLFSFFSLSHSLHTTSTIFDFFPSQGPRVDLKERKETQRIKLVLFDLDLGGVRLASLSFLGEHRDVWLASWQRNTPILPCQYFGPPHQLLPL